MEDKTKLGVGLAVGATLLYLWTKKDGKLLPISNTGKCCPRMGGF